MAGNTLLTHLVIAFSVSLVELESLATKGKQTCWSNIQQTGCPSSVLF